MKLSPQPNAPRETGPAFKISVALDLTLEEAHLLSERFQPLLGHGPDHNTAGSTAHESGLGADQGAKGGDISVPRS